MGFILRKLIEEREKEMMRNTKITFSKEDLKKFLDDYEQNVGGIRGALKEVQIELINTLYDLTSKYTEEELRKDAKTRTQLISKIENVFSNYQYFKEIYTKKKYIRRGRQ